MTVSAPIDVLALSPQHTSTSELLAAAARARGIQVHAADEVPAAARGTCAYYGGPLLGAKVGDALGLGLLVPPDDFLQSLPAELVGRRVEAMTAAEARHLTRPFFAKPPSDKSFDAGVFTDGTRLPQLPPEAGIQVSEIVTFAEEHRLFLLDAKVHAASRYARFGRLDVAPATAAALAFGAEVAEAVTGSPLVPSAVVVDIGLISDPDTGTERWAVVEANMAWFAHSYAADPDRVLDIVIASAGPVSAVSDADRRFLAGPRV
ncbi:ATP-grasp domain-containing protein [Catenulispora sp. NF23]|uniref:ATP-grasp domain-containing protein n=1 Tax=Catenulispora pinistramenti TaxID=2705254 RepID=A0ABS5L6C1_9ACTN|nr:ATP-grasp domain-containing protein [Catenulispora pinistramenti]MBS2540235.1 ATP-grasp domain-containing protein [Catenulispora pinistramenti]MBS2553780.1 ATP-grasp domain-containing protein [Catenulispora pinistramenti]